MNRDRDERVPDVSPFLWRWFSWYARRFLRKHFHAVRLARDVTPPDVPPDIPLVICANHPSWWDPMVAIFLSERLWPERRHYWPIDAEMLRKYRFFSRLGFFGVDQTPRGAAAFLRTAGAVCRRPNTAVWVTAEGEFSDVRRRPLRLRPGVAHLAQRLDHVIVLPLAAEYTFWGERTPEVLLRFGEPLAVGSSAGISKEHCHDALTTHLEAAMDALASSAIARDAGAFETLLAGATGTGGVYDLWRRGVARWRGERFDPDHMSGLATAGGDRA